MYSPILRKLVGKEVMIQIAGDSNSVIVYRTKLMHIDKDVTHIQNPDGKQMYFNTSDVAMIGIGDFKPDRSNDEDDGRESYA